MPKDTKAPPVCPGAGLGMPVTISFAGSETSKSVLIGMEYGQFLIVKPPPLPEFPASLYQKNQTVVRYFYAGRAYGFRTTLVSLIREPVRLLILAYPETIESLNLRKNERYACRLPAGVVLNLSGDEPENWQGYITDISADGCRFECSTLDGKKPAKLNVGDAAEISFHSTPENVRRMLHSEVRIFSIDERRLIIGLKYAVNPDSQYQQNSLIAIAAILESLKTEADVMGP